MSRNENAPSRALQTQERPRSPFSLIDRFLDDPLFEPFSSLSPRLLGGSLGAAFPKVDVSETDGEIRVVANVPGMSPDDIDIEVGDDYLSLSGRIEKERKGEDAGKIYRYEREYGEFRREFALPARVNKEGIVAKAKDGVLTITLPKSEEERRTRVRIETDG